MKRQKDQFYKRIWNNAVKSCNWNGMVAVVWKDATDYVQKKLSPIQMMNASNLAGMYVDEKCSVHFFIDGIQMWLLMSLKWHQSWRPEPYEEVQPVSPRALSLVGKTSNCKLEILTTPKTGPKKTLLVIAFRIAWTPYVKIV